MYIFRKFFLKRALKKQKSGGYEGWQKARKVLVVFDRELNSAPELINQLEQKLVAEQKQVQLMGFISDKKPRENIPINSYFKRDVCLGGVPKKRVKKLIEIPVDVIIDWSKEDKSPNDFILASTDAKMKVGVSKDLSCFDLIVKDAEPERVIEEIFKYLKMINHE